MLDNIESIATKHLKALREELKEFSSKHDADTAGINHQITAIERSMVAAYENDIVAWASEQAYLLRSGKLSIIDIEHIADEIENIGISEQRELAGRMAVLIANLLKWQAGRQNMNLQRAIKDGRKAIVRRLTKMPSLNSLVNDHEWLEDPWGDAVSIAINEAGVGEFPESCPWSIENILSDDWLPVANKF